eukprot:CAMPEP_0179229090 /NCGR_PEP_ID=MMETSP0797-20121207/10156_1 /TAXON_ID=47934 /ORGANISM="Dinophysis acuminata, Strain DAEP01" /LENGTH=253 /DNA_ID=CAMNT_0020936151 /DNA_START=55 /DNA_END=819 /DNA_ORIENTATION=-
MALKKKKTGAKKSAGDDAAGSPKVAPAPSPKAAPAPDTKGKGDAAAKEKKGPEPRPLPTEEEKAAAAEIVFNMIARGLEEDKHCQDKGFAFIPKNYKTEYKGILGPYKHFVESCPKLRLVPGPNLAQFTVQLASGTKAELSDGPKPKWEVDMQKAWLCYCRAIPRGQRNPDEFVDASRRVAAIRDKPKKDKQKPAPGEERDGAGGAAGKPAAKARKRERDEEKAGDEPEDEDVAPPPTKKNKEKKKKSVSAGN